MDTTNQAAENERTGRGYAGAVLISALGHLALGVLLLVVLPAYVHAPQKELPSYTVKIVDNIPAGDLGSHLPRLSRRPPSPPQEVKPRPRVEEPPKVVVKPPPAPPPPDNDKNAIALNSVRTTAPTPMPTPTPKPVMPPAPQPSPKPAPTRALSHHPTPKPTVHAHEPPRPKPSPAVVIAKAESTSSVKQRLDKIREQLLAEHLTQVKKAPPDADAADSDDSDDQASGGGPVVAKAATEGKGLGIGSGRGSAGIQQDLDFLLYYRSVQERIKQAWSFSGGNNDLTTKVVFAIGADGKLSDVKITQSSRNAAFDDSVIRAIRRAAPFTAPPDKYRDQFVKGIEAVFKLGELNS